MWVDFFHIYETILSKLFLILKTHEYNVTHFSLRKRKQPTPKLTSQRGIKLLCTDANDFVFLWSMGRGGNEMLPNLDEMIS